MAARTSSSTMMWIVLMVLVAVAGTFTGLPQLGLAFAEDGNDQAPKAGPKIGKAIVNAQVVARMANVQPEGEEDEAYADILFPTDRTTVRLLSTAKELLKSERYSEAVRHLGRILDAEQDYFFQPDPQMPYHRSLKAEAVSLIGQLPAEGREAYQLQYAAQARRMLTEAVEAGDRETVAEVSRKYFHTDAGYEATLLLASDHLDRGRALAAALCLERLRSSTQVASKWEPMLSLQLATCWLRAGLTENAAATLQALRQDSNSDEITVGGESIAWFADDEDAVQWFSERLGPQLQGGAGQLAEWLMFRGNASRTAVTPGSSPLLNPRWKVPTTDDPTIEKILQELQERYDDQHLTSLPSVHPLVVDDVVLMRTTSNLLAVDLITGKRLWNVPADDSIEALLDVRGGAAANTPQLESGLQRRIWDDATYGTLSSDGENVYSIEDLNPFGGLVSVRVPARAIFNRSSTSHAFNRLAAHDVSNGKMVWELGGPSGEDALPLADTYFLGPPLPLAGQLYCLTEKAGEIQLLALSAKTGQVEWSQQLAMLERNILQDPLRARCGASPSYADGVMVCPTSAGAVIAVDLSTRSLLWGYRYPVTDNYQANARMMIVQRGGAVFQAGSQVDASDSWADSSVTIADGHVVLTPTESGEMYCLDLLDGSLKWKQDRQDGLYVAGVHDGNVIVVGRNSLTALHLEDGQRAWGDATFPESASPSGRGFINGSQLFLPLSTAEVATFDLEDGELVARSKSRDGTVPGNLICHGGAVLAQGVQNLESFYQLEHLENEVKDTLLDEPENATALALRGEIRLHSGAVDEAVADLRHSLALSPDPHTQQLLVDALLEGLRIDFAAHRSSIDELETLIEQPEHRSRFLRLLATGWHEIGEVDKAFAAYLRFTDPSLGPLGLEQIDGVLSVRRDRWVRTRIGELWEVANEQQQQAMNAELQARLASVLESSDTAELDQFLDYFGIHDLSQPARVELVDRLLDEDGLRAEFELRKLEASSTPEVSHRATAQLALLLEKSRRPQDAAHYYEKLNGPLADVVCLEGKTGAELFAEVSESTSLLAAIDDHSPWPSGQVEKTRQEKNVNPMRYFGFEIQGPKDPFFDDIHIEIDQNRRTLVGRDGLGQAAWQVNVVEPGTNNGPNFNQHVNHGRVAGHLLLLTLGHELLAIDVLHSNTEGGPENGARILWRRSLAETVLGGRRNAVPQFRQFQAPWGNRIVVNANGWQPAGTLCMVTEDFVCFEENRKLIVADPLTGETLWVRRDVSSGSTVWGDSELLVVAPAEGAEALLLRASDGEELGKCKVSRPEQRVCTMGRNVVDWNVTREGSVVHMLNPCTGDEAWSHTFEKQARARLINDEELAIVEPSGRLVLLNLADGKIKIDCPIAEEKNLHEVYALRSKDHYVIVANRPWQQAANVFINPLPGGFGCVVVNGMVYGFDRNTGEKLWSQEVRNQGLVLTQPCEMPVVAFASQIHRQQINNRGGRRYETAVVCLDKRTGHILHQERQANTVSAVNLVADPAIATVELNMQRAKVLMKFTDEPFDPNAVPSDKVINGATEEDESKDKAEEKDEAEGEEKDE